MSPVTDKLSQFDPGQIARLAFDAEKPAIRVRAVSNREHDALLEGNAYLVSTGPATLAAAGNFRVSVSNPANSGKMVLIKSIVTTSTAVATAFATFYKNPTTGMPTANTKSPVNCIFASDPTNESVVVLKYDTNLTTPLSGGTPVISFGIPTGRTAYDETPFLIMPGVTLGMNLPFAGAGSGEVVIYFTEIPAT